MRIIYSYASMMQQIIELTRMILKRTCHIKLDKIGKLLSAILERTDPLLRATE